MTQSSPKLIDDVVTIIEQYFGPESKKLYANFYTTLDNKTILASAQELFIETMGPKIGEEVYMKIQKKYEKN